MKQSKTDLRNARNGYLLTLPLVAGCLIFYAIPFILVVRYSMVKGISSSQRFVGLDNYLNLLNNSVFRLAFGNTLKFLAIALPLILVVSYSLALLIKQQARKHQALKSVIMLPYIMPVVGTVLLVDLFFAQSGLLNKALYTLGLPVSDWLGSEHAFWIAIMLYIWKNTGYSVILLLSGLVAIPKEHYQAAAVDGASSWRQFLHVTMPQMWYSVFFAVMFSLINAFKCFREIFLIGGTHPHDSIYMMQHFINNSFENLNYPKLAVASVLLLVVLLVLFAIGYRLVNRKEAFRA